MSRTAIKKGANTALSGPRSARTLRLQMALGEQQRLERAQRIRQLREESPYTQQAIAERIEITLRAYQKWEEGGGIEWDNLEALADLHEVDVQWIHRGQDRQATPDLNQRLADLEATVGELVDELRADRAVQIAKAAGQEKRESHPQHQAERPAKRKKAEGG